jgi:hypothetical protein
VVPSGQSAPSREAGFVLAMNVPIEWAVPGPFSPAALARPSELPVKVMAPAVMAS